MTKMHLLTKSSIWHCSFQTSHLLVKKDISSFRHYLSFLHTFCDCIITVPSRLFEFHCCCVMIWHWASRIVCNSSIHTFCLLYPVTGISLVYKFFQLSFQLFWIFLTGWSVILEPLLLPVSLQRFNVDYSSYTSNLELHL